MHYSSTLRHRQCHLVFHLFMFLNWFDWLIWRIRLSEDFFFKYQTSTLNIFSYNSVFLRRGWFSSGITSVTTAPRLPLSFMDGWEDCETSLTSLWVCVSVCVCVCAHVYCVCMNWRWSCGVSDDTSGVIPPTSASNLQHEKDTRMTPYVPPTIFYPHPAPSAWCCSFSFQPKSNSVSSYERFWPQLAIRHTKQGVYICFMCILPFPRAVVREFHSVCCLLHVLFELLFFLLFWDEAQQKEAESVIFSP